MLQGCATSGYENEERTANVVEKVDDPLAATIFHWTFFEIVTD
jgi:hypothetical protein